MKKNILIHSHIFKNAGSTLDSVLKRQFLTSFCLHTDDEVLINGGNDYLDSLLNSNPEILAFSSHSIFFYPQNSEIYNYITLLMLRHPIERMRSVYEFERLQQPAIHMGSKMAKVLEFKSFVAWYMTGNRPFTIRNAQTIFLSANGFENDNMDYKFELAKERLADQNTLIGIVDRYDESMVLFEEELRRFFPNIDLSYPQRENVGSYKCEENKDLSQEEKIQDIINELGSGLTEVFYKNSMDLNLYEKANELLNIKIKSIVNFNEKLADYKHRCAKSYNKKYETVQNSKELTFTYKKSIFFQGNCQADGLMWFFKHIPRLKNIFNLFEIQPVHLWRDEDKELIYKNISLCDVFVHQPVSENFKDFSSDKLLHMLKNNAKVISFPVAYFTGYHPESFYFTNRDNSKADYFCPYHDANIVYLYSRGFSVNEIFNFLTDIDFYSVEYIKTNIDTSLLQLQKRESMLTVKMEDYISRNMLSNNLFFTMNHPNDEALVHMLNEILSKLGVEPLTQNELNIVPLDILGVVKLYIYPSICKYFQIEYKDFGIYDRIQYSFKDVIHKYFEIYNQYPDLVEHNLNILSNVNHAAYDYVKSFVESRTIMGLGTHE
jgi:hypothetical protein